MCCSLNHLLLVIATAVAQEVAVKLQDDCAPGWSPVTASKWACRAAMDIVDWEIDRDMAGSTFWGTGRNTDWPSGCFYCKDTPGCLKGTWFNTRSGQSGSGMKRPEKSVVKRYCQKGLYASLQATTVLFVGDDVIDDWHTSKLVAGSHNIGVAGYTCKDVYNDMRRGGLVSKKTFSSKAKRMGGFSFGKTFGQPETLVLSCGRNDVGLGEARVKTAFAYVEKIVELALKNAMVKKVIFIGNRPYAKGVPGGDRRQLLDFDQKIRKLARRLMWDAWDQGAQTLPFVMIDVAREFDRMDQYGFIANIHKKGGGLTTEGYSYLNKWLQCEMVDTVGYCARRLGCDCITGGTPSPPTPGKLRLLSETVTV